MILYVGGRYPDYRPSPRSVTVYRGRASQLIRVNINRDNRLEFDESFFVVAYLPKLCEGDTNRTVPVTIENDDGELLSFAKHLKLSLRHCVNVMKLYIVC